MNYLKNVFITTILLNLAMICASEYSAYTQETPVNIEEQVNVPEVISAPEETIQEPTQPLTDTEQWNNHLSALAENDEFWDTTSNLPSYSWKRNCYYLRKNIIDKDKSLAESLKTEFLNTVSVAIEQKNGTLSAAYTFIQGFDNAIDAYLKSITEPEVKEEPKPVEEIVQPIVETPAPAPVEEAPAPTPPASEEPKVTPTETAPTTETPQDIFQQWNSILEGIAKEGTTLEENRTLLQKTYPIARELFMQKPQAAETIQLNLEDALAEHNKNLLLEPINIQQAMTAFSEATGISLDKDMYNQQNQQKIKEQELKLHAEKQAALEKQKEGALKIATLEKINEQPASPKSSEIAELTARLKQKFAATQEENDKKIELLKQELATLRKTKEKAPETEGGVWESLKNIASSASKWWYGDSESTIALDKERSTKLDELLNVMALTDYQKLLVKENWDTFIQKLRAFKDLDTHDVTAVKEWLTNIQQALEYITITHHIISKNDALDITKDALKEYPESTTFINEIKKYLEEKRRKIIEKKEQEEFAEIKKAQEKQEEKDQVLRERQRRKTLKDLSEKRKKEELEKKEAYNQIKNEWQQFLQQLRRQDATEEENNKNTEQAVKIARSLISSINIPEDRKREFDKKLELEQQLKNEFTAALVAQPKVNQHEINIQENLKSFYNDLHTMTQQ